jgi:putative redox protein
MAEGAKDVKVTLAEGLRCTLEVRDHDLVADEPTDKGGSDEGPTPMELMLLGLGSCTAMTLRMYANHKSLPLESVEVSLEHAWVTPEEWEDWPEGDERKRLPRIRRKIEVTGDLTEEQRERLLYIAGRCPVHRTITEDPVVVDELI